MDKIYQIITSIIVAYMVFLVLDYYKRKKKKDNFFTPYTVWITLKGPGFKLFEDYRLINDDNREKFKATFNDPNATLVARDGITFTVLRRAKHDEESGDEIESGLVFCDYNKTFTSVVDICERITGLENCRNPQADDPLRSFVAHRIFVRGGAYGYDIGITTPESIQEFDFEDQCVVITTLPYFLFENLQYSRKIEKLKPEQLEILKKYGLTLSEESYSPGFEPRYLSLYFDQKYFFGGIRAI